MLHYCYSYNKLLLQKEELEQKHLHLLQVGQALTVAVSKSHLFEVFETEKTAKWEYKHHDQDLTREIEKLRGELEVSSQYFKKKILTFIICLSS